MRALLDMHAIQEYHPLGWVARRGPVVPNGRIPMLAFFGGFMALAAYDALLDLIARYLLGARD